MVILRWNQCTLPLSTVISDLILTLLLVDLKSISKKCFQILIELFVFLATLKSIICHAGDVTYIESLLIDLLSSKSNVDNPFS